MLSSCWNLKVSQRTVKLKGTSPLNHELVPEHFVISVLRCFCIWFVFVLCLTQSFTQQQRQVCLYPGDRHLRSEAVHAVCLHILFYSSNSFGMLCRRHGFHLYFAEQCTPHVTALLLCALWRHTSYLIAYQHQFRCPTTAWCWSLFCLQIREVWNKYDYTYSYIFVWTKLK